MALPGAGRFKWRTWVQSVELLQALWSLKVEFLKLQGESLTRALDVQSNPMLKTSLIGVPGTVLRTDGVRSQIEGLPGLELKMRNLRNHFSSDKKSILGSLLRWWTFLA